MDPRAVHRIKCQGVPEEGDEVWGQGISAEGYLGHSHPGIQGTLLLLLLCVLSTPGGAGAGGPAVNEMSLEKRR